MTVDVRVKSDKDLLGKKLRWQQEQNRYPTQACSFRKEQLSRQAR